MITTTGHALERKYLPKSITALKEETKDEFLIFLVDDDLFYLNALSYFLSSSLPVGFKIKTFTTAKDCIASLELKPDIVVLDIFLNSDPPETNYGLDVIKRIRHFSPYSRVIALSSTANPDIINIMYDRGAYDYIRKDERSNSKLLQIIKTSCEWFSSEQEEEIAASNRVTIIILVLILAMGILNRLM